MSSTGAFRRRTDATSSTTGDEGAGGPPTRRARRRGPNSAEADLGRDRRDGGVQGDEGRGVVEQPLPLEQCSRAVAAAAAAGDRADADGVGRRDDRAERERLRRTSSRARRARPGGEPDGERREHHEADRQGEDRVAAGPHLEEATSAAPRRTAGRAARRRAPPRARAAPAAAGRKAAATPTATSRRGADQPTFRDRPVTATMSSRAPTIQATVWGKVTGTQAPWRRSRGSVPSELPLVATSSPPTHHQWQPHHPGAVLRSSNGCSKMSHALLRPAARARRARPHGGAAADADPRDAGHQPRHPTLQTHPALAPLLPGGALKAGAAYAVPGSATLADGAAGRPERRRGVVRRGRDARFRREAAGRFGIDLERLVLVPHPGEQWLTVDRGDRRRAERGGASRRRARATTATSPAQRPAAAAGGDPDRARRLAAGGGDARGGAQRLGRARRRHRLPRLPRVTVGSTRRREGRAGAAELWLPAADECVLRAPAPHTAGGGELMRRGARAIVLWCPDWPVAPAATRSWHRRTTPSRSSRTGSCSPARRRRGRRGSSAAADPGGAGALHDSWWCCPTTRGSTRARSSRCSPRSRRSCPACSRCGPAPACSARGGPPGTTAGEEEAAADSVLGALAGAGSPDARVGIADGPFAAEQAASAPRRRGARAHRPAGRLAPPSWRRCRSRSPGCRS